MYNNKKSSIFFMGMILTICVFSIELLIMSFLDTIVPDAHGILEAFVDSSILIILILPLIYFFVMRPMYQQNQKHVRYEIELLRKNKVLDVLNELIEKAITIHSFHDLTRIIIKRVTNLSEADFGFFAQIDHTKRLEIMATSETILDDDDSFQQEIDEIKKINIRVYNEWLLPIAMNKILLLKNIKKLPDQQIIFPSIVDDVNSVLGLPIVLREDLLGMMVLSKKQGNFSDIDKEALSKMIPFLKTILNKKTEDINHLEAKGVYI